jgi:hypothetical protein
METGEAGHTRQFVQGQLPVKVFLDIVYYTVYSFYVLIHGDLNHTPNEFRALQERIGEG